MSISSLARAAESCLVLNDDDEHAMEYLYMSPSNTATFTSRHPGSWDSERPNKPNSTSCLPRVYCDSFGRCRLILDTLQDIDLVAPYDRAIPYTEWMPRSQSQRCHK